MHRCSIVSEITRSAAPEQAIARLMTVGLSDSTSPEASRPPPSLVRRPRCACQLDCCRASGGDVERARRGGAALRPRLNRRQVRACNLRQLIVFALNIYLGLYQQSRVTEVHAM